MCSWARVPATVEVWGLFSHLIPAEALSRMEDRPLFQTLDSIMGLCFGAWGEGWKDVHELVDIIAKSRLKLQLRDEGRPDEGSDNELALITGQVRRVLSQTAVKAHVSCLLSRIHQVGPGNKQIAKKRQWALQQDEKMRKERSAQWIRRIEGVNTLRKGMIRSFGWKAIPIYSKLKNCFLQIVEI